MTDPIARAIRAGCDAGGWTHGCRYPKCANDSPTHGCSRPTEIKAAIVAYEAQRATPKQYCGHPDCTGDDTCEQTKVCMCGSLVEEHGMGDGHSPVSMHDYLAQPEERATDASFAHHDRGDEIFGPGHSVSSPSADEIVKGAKRLLGATDASDLEYAARIMLALHPRLQPSPSEIRMITPLIADARQAAAREMRERCVQVAEQYIENPTSGPNNNTQEAFDVGMDHMAGAIDNAGAILAAIRALPDNA